MTETADGLAIEPGPLHGGTVASEGDHHMATFAALLGLRVAGVVVDDVSVSETVLVLVQMQFDDPTIGGGIEVLFDQSILEFSGFDFDPGLGNDAAVEWRRGEGADLAGHARLGLDGIMVLEGVNECFFEGVGQIRQLMGMGFELRQADVPQPHPV